MNVIEEGDLVQIQAGMAGICIGTCFDLAGEELIILQSSDRVQLFIGSIRKARLIQKQVQKPGKPVKILPPLARSKA